MGLFDTVRCEYPLPQPEHQDLEFQTKDLECFLGHCTITRDGRLIRAAANNHWRIGLARDVTWPLHGDLRFYTSIGDGEEMQWIEYVARFTHGRVEWIRDDEEVKSLLEERPPHAGLPPVEDDASEPDEDAGGVRDGERALLANLRPRAAELDTLLESCSDHWGFEDPIYRFYHQSFKVYALQQKTRDIVRVLEELAPERPLHRWFLTLVEEGTGKQFEPEHNADWLAVTRPILEAFFHARFFLEMAVRYAYLEEPPSPLPSGSAALLELYGLR